MVSPINLKMLLRPQSFSDFVGQDEACTRALELLHRNHGGTVVLHGPAGVGKTALAAVMAQAFLCDARRPDGSPCNQCPPCLGVRNGALAGALYLISGPDDGRVKQISEAVAKADEGRPCAIVIDDADRMQRQPLRILRRAVDRHRPTTLIVLTMQSLEVAEQRDPGLRSRYQCLHMPRVPISVLRNFLEKTATSLGAWLPSDDLDCLGTAAGGSVALALQHLEQFLRSGETAASLEAMQPAAAAAERLLGEIVVGVPGASNEVLLARHSPEALRVELEEHFGACLEALRLLRPTEGFLALLADALRRAAQHHNIGAGECAEDLVRIWRPAAAPMSAPGFAAALSKTERRLLGALQLPKVAEKAARSQRLRIQTDARPHFGKYLSAQQAGRLTDYCSSALRDHGVTVRIVARLIHANARSAPGTMGELTHGLSMFMSKRGVPKPGWFYVHRRRADCPETLLGILLPLDQVEAAASWLSRRLFEASFRICRETSDERRLAFQVSALRDACSALDPALYFADADGRRRFLLDVIGVAQQSRGPLGEAFTDRVIGVSKAYGHAPEVMLEPRVSLYDTIIAGFDPSTLALRRRADRVGKS